MIRQFSPPPIRPPFVLLDGNSEHAAHEWIKNIQFVRLFVLRIGPIAPLLLLWDNFVPFRDTIKSTVAATGIGKMENTPDVKRICM